MEASRIVWTIAAAVMAAGLSALAGSALLGTQVRTTLDAFFQPGSQPNGELYGGFTTSDNCQSCHENQAPQEPDFEIIPSVIFPSWQGSMMAQSMRDPLFFACLAIANQDAAFAGDVCLRCHTPTGWLAGRSEPTDGSALDKSLGDFDGVNCTVCHLMVDPVLKPSSPFADEAILDSIVPLPVLPGGGNFIMDPEDRRRGPYNYAVDENVPPHFWQESPFHTTSELCATCHDVSNPLYERDSNDQYILTALDAAHPTGNKYDMFPLERTYSEWLNSEFATSGVDMQGKFGGNKPIVSTCQDCHMPDTDGYGCDIGGDPGYPFRTDLGSHAFAGGNAWVQDMILNLYPDDNLSPKYLQDGQVAAREMLRKASTVELVQQGNHIRVRLFNDSGHKLPTGYPEGRRMWINVAFADDALTLLGERGHYDGVAAELSTGDTKVYEAKLGLDDTVASATGHLPGPTFHFALANVVVKDNRIPPRGFSNEAYKQVQAKPVAATYADGQYWDDTRYRLPAGSTRADVKIFYQTASKDYVTFLRDANVTDDTGDTLYAQWELTGKSPPILIALDTIMLESFADGDFNTDETVDLFDFSSYDQCATGPAMTYTDDACAAFDFDADGDVDLLDKREFDLVYDP